MIYHPRAKIIPFRGPTPEWQPTRPLKSVRALLYGIGCAACLSIVIGAIIVVGALMHGY